MKDKSRSAPPRISREISNSCTRPDQAPDSAEEHLKLADHAAAEAAWKAFMHAGQQIASRFRPGMSGVRELSRMRR